MTQPTSYKLRTEYPSDALLIRLIFHSWIVHWEETQARLAHPDHGSTPIPDVDVSFTLVSGAPGLSELRWLLLVRDDLHVAVESLAFAKDYTGDRSYGRSVGVSPSSKVILQVVESLGTSASLVTKTLIALIKAS